MRYLNSPPGYIAVAQAERGRGAGQLLLEDCIAHLDRVGCKSICLDAVPSAVGLYEKYGFRRAEEDPGLLTWAREAGKPRPLRTGPYPELAVTRLEGTDGQGLALVQRLDQRHTPFDRPGLIQSLLSSPGWKAWFTSSGCIVCRPTGSGYGIGPFYASTGSEAESLMHAVLSDLGTDASYYAESSSDTAVCSQVYLKYGWEIDTFHQYTVS